MTRLATPAERTEDTSTLISRKVGVTDVAPGAPPAPISEAKRMELGAGLEGTSK